VKLYGGAQLYPEEIFRGAGEAAVVDIQQRRRTMNWLADVIVVAWFFPVVVYGLIPLMIGVGWALGKLFGGVSERLAQLLATKDSGAVNDSLSQVAG
jgi:hypothetical protein